jgi:chromosomal replication initiation ATPase DnaA
MLFSPQRQLTFANFKCRPGSARARSAAAALAIWPSIGHDGPLLILAGRSGSGKTHLLHASVNLAKQRHDCNWRSSTLSAWRLVKRCSAACTPGPPS